MSNLKLVPYQGEMPYVFISYAHRDMDIVYSIINCLIAKGMRIWFDEGIDPGTEWDDNIAAHVQGCDSMIAFISANYLNSDNCRDELNYARDLKKDRLLIYLEQVELPAGMAMRMNRIQAINEELGRHVEKIIDKTGKEKFHSVYTFIRAWHKPPYQVVIRKDDGDQIGLIDENGNELIPCQDDIAWDGILYDQKRIIFKNGENKGVRDFDGNVIIPAKYLEIHYTDKPLLSVRIGEKDNYKEGLLTRDGIEVIPAEYRYIILYKDNYIVCCRNGHCEMLRYYVE